MRTCLLLTLGILIPFVALMLSVLILKFEVKPIAWVVVVALCVVYFGSAKFAEEQGEEDEHKVEKLVGHDALEEHEEAGEQVPLVALVLLGFAIAPLALRRQKWLMFVFVLASLGGVYPLYQAGHSGGELVYKHGAADAHLKSVSGQAETVHSSEERDHDHDD